MAGVISPVVWAKNTSNSGRNESVTRYFTLALPGFKIWQKAKYNTFFVLSMENIPAKRRLHDKSPEFRPFSKNHKIANFAGLFWPWKRQMDFCHVKKYRLRHEVKAINTSHALFLQEDLAEILENIFLTSLQEPIRPISSRMMLRHKFRKWRERGFGRHRPLSSSSTESQVGKK